jgi:tRNA(fMet)-specific endonuclease VapC
MNRRYLLDTNVLVDAFKARLDIPTTIQRSEAVFVSEIVLGEFKAGLNNSASGRKQREALDAFLRLPNVVEITLTPATTDLYAKVFRSLREAGRPIPVNDIWLAAQALEHGAVLVSRDRHFGAVANLQTLIED